MSASFFKTFSDFAADSCFSNNWDAFCSFSVFDTFGSSSDSELESDESDESELSSNFLETNRGLKMGWNSASKLY